MNNLFATLESVLMEGESLDFKISRSGSKLTVLLIPSVPNVPSAPGTSDPQLEQARAALSFPLRFEMTGAELDADFEQRLSGFALQRGVLRDSYELLLSELKEANKATQAKTAAKNRRAPEKPNAASPEPEAPAQDPTPKASSEGAPAATTAAGTNAASDMSQPLSLFESLETAK